MPHTTKFRAWLSRLRAWMQGKRKNPEPLAEDKILSVVVLPQEASCMGGALKIALPQSFRVLKNDSSQTTFGDNAQTLVLTVSRMPFEGSLKLVTQETLEQAFFRQLGTIRVETFERGYVRYAPKVTVHYKNIRRTREEDAVIVLIQKKKFVYALLFTGEVKKYKPIVDTMISTIQLA